MCLFYLSTEQKPCIFHDKPRHRQFRSQITIQCILIGKRRGVFPAVFLGLDERATQPENALYISSNNKTLNARLLARVITGLHVMEQPPRFFALAYRASEPCIYQ